MLVGTLNRNVTSRPADRNNQFDFVMKFTGLRGVRHFADLTGDNRHDGICWFTEKERWLAGRIKPHLSGMGRIVASDAVDSAHGKEHISSSHRNGYGGFRFKNIGHWEWAQFS